MINKLSWLHFVHPNLSNLNCQLFSMEHADKGFTKSQWQKLDFVLSYGTVLLIFLSFNTIMNQSTYEHVIRKRTTSNKHSGINKSEV